MFGLCSLVFFGMLGFPEGLFGVLKTLGKTNKKQTNKKTYPRVGLKPLKTLYVWFSRMFVWFSKNLRENQQKTNKQNPYPRVGLKPLKNVVVLVFPNVLLVF